jgi:hypothetical protein
VLIADGMEVVGLRQDIPGHLRWGRPNTTTEGHYSARTVSIRILRAAALAFVADEVIDDSAGTPPGARRPTRGDGSGEKEKDGAHTGPGLRVPC